MKLKFFLSVLLILGLTITIHAGDTTAPVRVLLTTDRGEIELTLDPVHAPARVGFGVAVENANDARLQHVSVEVALGAAVLLEVGAEAGLVEDLDVAA